MISVKNVVFYPNRRSIGPRVRAFRTWVLALRNSTDWWVEHNPAHNLVLWLDSEVDRGPDARPPRLLPIERRGLS